MKVSLGVTGCIAAYKAVEVMRGLQKLGVAVQVVMTRHATQFVGPLTFQAISGLPVITEMFAPTDDPEIKHIEIAQSVDLLLVAPATANVLAKFANGIADDFLSTLYISTTAPVLVAPAMNVEMWAHPATRENVRRLKERGVRFVDPGEGYLACRTVGAGRLAEPSEIIERAWSLLHSTPRGANQRIDLAGERILITAGPTFEAIDPVRGITNRSSGKMGFALASAALDRGADVKIVSGPVSIDPPAGAEIVRVRSAAEMYDAVMANLEQSSIILMAAAVADYRPSISADQKIKKNSETILLELERTQDILAAAGQRKGDRILVGFAAETQHLIENGRKKLTEKGADLIVANDVSASDSGFDVDTNKVTLITSQDTVELPLLTKREVADRILNKAIQLKQKSPDPVADISQYR
ncbi:MAG TPA: bifunctional phosphopantothenoylcysteine decarboxylase/phosphopantothenate--cysteine ligase CoaBC [Blastocatellia bacterium]|nr:bifunctional phosphopantothenoylcysteine decarboxylase/phosphopantothenate--cysteine ligase CoaBC [Blastocatellia bacterium]